jgi:hypothetical protein
MRDGVFYYGRPNGPRPKNAFVGAIRRVSALRTSLVYPRRAPKVLAHRRERSPVWINWCQTANFAHRIKTTAAANTSLIEDGNQSAYADYNWAACIGYPWVAVVRGASRPTEQASCHTQLRRIEESVTPLSARSRMRSASDCRSHLSTVWSVMHTQSAPCTLRRRSRDQMLNGGAWELDMRYTS